MLGATYFEGIGTEIKVIFTKLQRLLDSYLDQDIEREDYLVKKAELLALKKKLEEQTLKFQQTQNAWLEPLKLWIMETANAANIARGDNLEEKKVLALKIFGSNLKLTDKKVCSKALNQWAALRAAPPTRDWERVREFQAYSIIYLMMLQRKPNF